MIFCAMGIGRDARKTIKPRQVQIRELIIGWAFLYSQHQVLLASLCQGNTYPPLYLLTRC
jgi:hypothetical protein